MIVSFLLLLWDLSIKKLHEKNTTRTDGTSPSGQVLTLDMCHVDTELQRCMVAWVGHGSNFFGPMGKQNSTTERGWWPIWRTTWFKYPNWWRISTQLFFFKRDLLAFLRCLSPAYQTLGPRHAVVKNGRWHAGDFFADDQRRLLDDSVVDTHQLDGFSYNVICSFSTLSKSLEFCKQHVSSNSPQLGYFSWKIYRLGCLGYRIMAV